MACRFRFIGAFFLPICCSLLSLGVKGQHFSHKVFTKVDGLPTDVIYDIIEDDQGFLWIATGYGISKFDGYSFSNYGVDNGLADIDAFVLRKDRFGRIWVIGNSSRLSVIENGKVRPYEYNHILEKHPALCIDLFVESDRTLHYSTTDGQLIIKPDGNYQLIDSTVNYIGMRVVETDEKKPYMSQYRMEKPPRPRGPKVVRFCFEGKCHRTNSTIGHYGRKILMLNDTNWVFNVTEDSLALVTKEGIFPYAKLEAEIQCLLLIDGEIWVGTADGIEVLSIGQGFKITGSRTIYRNQSFSSIYWDVRKGVWCSTLNHGLIYIPQLKFRSFSKTDGLPFDLITAIELDKNGRIFLGGENGDLAVLEKDGTSFLLPDVLVYKKRIRDLFLSSNGDIYFDAYQSLVYRIDPSLNIFKIPLSKTEPKRTLKYISENRGNIYTSTGKGIAKIINDKIEKQSGKNYIRVTAFCNRDDSVFYMATLDGIICFNQNSKRSWNPFPYFNQRSTHIQRFDDKSFLFTSDGAGLFFIYNDTIINIGRAQGLKKLFFQKARVSGNTVWGITKQGLTKLKINSIDPLNFNFEEFDFRDGLGYGRFFDLKLVDSTVFLASTKGLIVFNERDAQFNLDPPKIVLTKVLLDGREIPSIDSVISFQGTSTIEFNFTGLNFISGGDFLYKYRLSGLDENWSYTKGRQIQFYSLPAGKYDFRVAARDHKDVWSKDLASFSFQVFPPFWKTWWFYVLEALLGSLIIFSLVNWRIRYLHGVEVKKEKEEREKAQLELDALKHQMNPHFLFNTLNSIQAFVSSSDRGEAVRYLSRFSRLIRRNLEHSKDTNVSLKEEIDFLQIYLDLERMRFDDAFDYEIKLDGIRGIDRIRIPNLIVQPYVENAILHGMNNLKRKGYIKVEFSFDDDMLKCVVEDNGVGRSKEKEDKGKGEREHRSVGMTITQRRLKLLNSKIVNPKVKVIDLVKNGMPSGTRIEIIMPYLVD